MPIDDLLDYDQAATLLNIPKGTLYCLVSERRIPHIRLGPRTVRFRRSELEEYLRERAVPARGSRP